MTCTWVSVLLGLKEAYNGCYQGLELQSLKKNIKIAIVASHLDQIIKNDLIVPFFSSVTHAGFFLWGGEIQI